MLLKRPAGSESFDDDGSRITKSAHHVIESFAVGEAPSGDVERDESDVPSFILDEGLTRRFVFANPVDPDMC